MPHPVGGAMGVALCTAVKIKGDKPASYCRTLSVRHIIVRARRALMGPYSDVVLVCMYVCMYVRNGFTTEVYEFTYTVCTLRH